MAIIEIPGGFLFPPPLQWNPTFDVSDNIEYQNYTLDSSAPQFAVIVRVPKSGTLKRFEFRPDALPQTPTNGLNVSFQDVDVAGEPNDVITYYRNIPSGDIAPNNTCIAGIITDDGTDVGNKKTVTRGDLLACVIGFESYDSGDEIQISSIPQSDFAVKGAYILTADGGGAWTKQAGIPMFALVYDDGEGGDEFACLTDALSIYSVTYSAFSQDPFTSAIDELGLAFTLTAPCRVGGAYVTIKSTEDFTINLIDTESATTLESVTIDLDEYFPNGEGIDSILVRFDTDRLLHPNQLYILSVTPSGTGELRVFTLEVYDDAWMAALPGGVGWHGRSRIDAGEWNIHSSSRPIFGLHITGIDHDISGGSGGPGWEGNP